MCHCTQLSKVLVLFDSLLNYVTANFIRAKSYNVIKNLNLKL